MNTDGAMGFPSGSVVKKVHCNTGDSETQVEFLGRKIPWRRNGTHPSHLAQKNSINRGASTVHEVVLMVTKSDMTQ